MKGLLATAVPESDEEISLMSKAGKIKPLQKPPLKKTKCCDN
jgi:hypothetical protein